MPLEVQSIPTTIFNHYRIRDLSTTIADVLRKYHNDNISFTPIAQELNVHSDDLGKAQNREQGNNLSVEIDALEEERDNLIKGFFSGVEFNLRHFSPKRRENAIAVHEQLTKQNSRIHDEADAVETLMIDTLVADMQSPAMAAALQVIDMSEFVSALKETNSRFVALVNERAEQESGKKTPLTYPTRKKLHQSLRAMSEYLTLVNRNNNGEFDSTIEEINQHIGQMSALAKADQTRKESDSE